jgi:hypothetical protein
MRLIGNGTKFCLILGGGERLQGQAMIFRGFSATPTKPSGAIDKSGKSQRSVGVLSRSVIC